MTALRGDRSGLENEAKRAERLQARSVELAAQAAAVIEDLVQAAAASGRVPPDVLVTRIEEGRALAAQSARFCTDAAELAMALDGATAVLIAQVDGLKVQTAFERLVAHVSRRRALEMRARRIARTRLRIDIDTLLALTDTALGLVEAQRLAVVDHRSRADEAVNAMLERDKALMDTVQETRARLAGLGRDISDRDRQIAKTREAGAKAGLEARRAMLREQYAGVEADLAALHADGDVLARALGAAQDIVDGLIAETGALQILANKLTVDAEQRIVLRSGIVTAGRSGHHAPEAAESLPNLAPLMSLAGHGMLLPGEVERRKTRADSLFAGRFGTPAATGG